MAKKKQKSTSVDVELVEAAAAKAGSYSALAKALGLAYTTVYRMRGGSGAIKLTELRRRQLQDFMDSAPGARSARASGAEQEAAEQGKKTMPIESTPRLAEWAQARNKTDPATYQRVNRTSERDLSFTGWEVGLGTFGYPGDDPKKWERGREVRLYVTSAGRIVVAIRKWSARPGEGVLHTAGVFADPDSAVSFLLEEGGGKLGQASKSAWEQACRNCEALADAETEAVE